MSEKFRIETDSLGEVNVSCDKFWGAQTQRSLENFKIGTEKIPREVITALVHIKMACAEANFKFGKLDKKRCDLIVEVCKEIINGKYSDNFPLSVWQTGSGTHSNMNVNEVISNVCKMKCNDIFVHPNDHVNMSQSSNDTFPTAMKISATLEIENKLLPAMKSIIKSFEKLENCNKGVIKIGRTHLQDAVPIGFWQEISGWKKCISEAENIIKNNLVFLKKVAIGGTAVGTGINAPGGFDKIVCEILSTNLGIQFSPDENKFHALTSLDAFVCVHGGLKALASSYMKIVNDIRWLASGPRCGLGEIVIPQNEPGSSIMPGKVNPTQCESAAMVSVQVMSNDVAIGFCASQGNFELNVYLPVCIYNFLQSVRLLADSIKSFEINCASGIKAVKENMKKNLEKSLMTATALNSVIGYEKAAKVAQKAYKEGISIKEAVLKEKFLSKDILEKILDPKNMI